MLACTQAIAITLAALLSFPLEAAAQTLDHATCTNASFAWSFNSIGQSPCAIGESLGRQCSDPGFTIQALPSGYFYSGMNRPYGTDCVCNTVYYSLLSVCGLCQGGYASPWKQWNANCTEVWTRQYPKDLPQGVPIPHYAYLALSSNDTIDFAAAKLDSGPEATATAVPTTHTGSNDPFNTDFPSDNDNTASKKKKKAPIGGIVGGVVGGLAAIGLIAVLVFVLLKKKANSRQAPSTAFIQRQSQLMAQQPMMGDQPVMGEQKVYDPSDPSTYPGATSPFTPVTTTFTGNSAPSNNGYNYTPTPYAEPLSPHGSFPNMAAQPPSPNQSYNYPSHQGVTPPAQDYSPPPQGYMPPPGNLQPQRQQYLPEL